MLSLLLLSAASEKTVHDISIAVWTGYEMILSRMDQACRTWVRQYPEVTIYSDFYPKGSKEKLQKLANPTKLNFIELGNCGKHLFFPSPWQRAQPRFVKAMEHLYRMNTSKKWYAFVDDDSFPIERNMVDIIQRYSSKEDRVLGRYYCAWPEVVFGNKYDTRCLDFAQGGAGVMITNHFFSRIADYLTDCNNKYRKRDYAGSMRFAKCAHDHFGDEWSEGRICTKLSNKFYSNDPVTEILEDGVFDGPINFHHLRGKKDIESVHHGIRTDWYTKSGRNLFIDWTKYSGREYTIYQGPGTGKMILRFGFTINAEGSFGVVGVATSYIVPTFSKEDTEKRRPIRFYQEFGDTAGLTIIVDENATRGSIDFDHIENIDRWHIFVRMRLPKVEEYHW